MTRAKWKGYFSFMAIRTILVPLDGSEAAYNVLQTALIVASRFGGHISALHVSHSALESATYLFSGISKALRDSVEIEDKQALTRQAQEIRSRFESFCRDNSISITDRPTRSGGSTASWRHEFGSVNDILIDYARLNDVTAFARSEQRKNVVQRGVPGNTLQAVMLGSGRPILVVPPRWQARKTEHAVIGWNHSQEASRALAMTIPWLLEMKKVTIAVAKKREAGGNRLVEYLAWHGIKSEIEILNRKSSSAGQRILEICDAVGGDFLVVGGFSTPRARERLFGGVTDHLLSSSNIITVIVH